MIKAKIKTKSNLIQLQTSLATTTKLISVKKIQTMSDKILNNVWNQLTKDELTDSDFETWKSNIVGDEEVQANVHEYLTDKELTYSD